MVLDNYLHIKLSFFYLTIMRLLLELKIDDLYGKCNFKLLVLPFSLHYRVS